jgi:hypothetical protein
MHTVPLFTMFEMIQMFQEFSDLHLDAYQFLLIEKERGACSRFHEFRAHIESFNYDHDDHRLILYLYKNMNICISVYVHRREYVLYIK